MPTTHRHRDEQVVREANKQAQTCPAFTYKEYSVPALYQFFPPNEWEGCMLVTQLLLLLIANRGGVELLCLNLFVEGIFSADIASCVIGEVLREAASLNFLSSTNNV